MSEAAETPPETEASELKPVLVKETARWLAEAATFANRQRGIEISISIMTDRFIVRGQDRRSPVQSDWPRLAERQLTFERAVAVESNMLAAAVLAVARDLTERRNQATRPGALA